MAQINEEIGSIGFQGGVSADVSCLSAGVYYSDAFPASGCWVKRRSPPPLAAGMRPCSSTTLSTRCGLFVSVWHAEEWRQLHMPRPDLAAVCLCRHGRQRMNRTSNGQNDIDHSGFATTSCRRIPSVRHCTLAM